MRLWANACHACFNNFVRGQGAAPAAAAAARYRCPRICVCNLLLYFGCKSFDFSFTFSISLLTSQQQQSCCPFAGHQVNKPFGHARRQLNYVNEAQARLQWASINNLNDISCLGVGTIRTNHTPKATFSIKIKYL